MSAETVVVNVMLMFILGQIRVLGPSPGASGKYPEAPSYIWKCSDPGVPTPPIV